MEVEKQFNLEGLPRGEQKRARKQAESTLRPFEEDIVPEMVNFYEGDGYEPAEGLLFEIEDEVESRGIQFNGSAGGKYRGREDGQMRIMLPYSTGLREPIHEMAHDVFHSTVDMEKEDDGKEIGEIVDDALSDDEQEESSVDHLVEMAYQEAFCDFNSLFFGELSGHDFEEEVSSIATPYRNEFEDTFEGLWEAINPEYVNKRRTALENAKGSLEAILDLEDENPELERNLGEQFKSNLEDYRGTPPERVRFNFFSGQVPFFVTQADEGYRIPVNEDGDVDEERIERVREMNERLSNYPDEPVAENAAMNKMNIDMALGAADKLGDVDEVDDWGEFVYGHINNTRGYKVGMEQDLDISHTVGARTALREYRRGNLPSDMIENSDEYMDEIQNHITEVIGTWMAYTGIEKDLNELEKGSEQRQEAVDDILDATDYQPDKNQEVVEKLYQNDPSELQPEDRHGLRYIVESLRNEHGTDEWFTDPYIEA